MDKNVLIINFYLHAQSIHKPGKLIYHWMVRTAAKYLIGGYKEFTGTDCNYEKNLGRSRYNSSG